MFTRPWGIPALAFACSVLLTPTGQAQEWPRFRGPNGQGQAEQVTAPAKWTLADCAWRVELPGIGYSSPVVNGNRLFVTTADETVAKRLVQCYSVDDGKRLWEWTNSSVSYRKHKDCGLASATPALDDQRVYTTWATPQEYLVVALSQETGKELWRRDLGAITFQHGFGSSPAIIGGLLIVPNDQEGDGNASTLTALDPATGELKWSVPRKSGRAAYSAPCLFEPPEGKPQLILSSSTNGLTGHDPATGKTLWTAALDPKQRVVGSPVIAGELVLASCGSGGGGKLQVMVRPGDPETDREAQVVHRLQGDLPYVPTPVVAGDVVFSLSDRGVLKCVDLKSGTTQWREKLEGTFYGSPICAGDRVYCMSKEGRLFVWAAKSPFELLATIDLGEPSFATPAVANGTLFLRTHSHLMAVK